MGTDTDLCPCGETQTMSHIVESCPLTKLNGGLSRLHSAVVMLNSNFFQNRNSNPKNRLKLETCFLLYPSSMVKRVSISTFDFHSRFVDRRSAHIDRRI